MAALNSRPNRASHEDETAQDVKSSGGGVRSLISFEGFISSYDDIQHSQSVDAGSIELIGTEMESNAMRRS